MRRICMQAEACTAEVVGHAKMLLHNLHACGLHACTMQCSMLGQSPCMHASKACIQSTQVRQLTQRPLRGLLQAPLRLHIGQDDCASS